jgi:ubiquinone/menaquinone biosynthesis C-methylase UbiE
MDQQKDFLPAAGHDVFLPLYDPLANWLGFDRARQELVLQANVTAGQHVLDLGCGTGTFAVRLKRQYPAVEVVGIDPDPKALRRARAKARRAAEPVKFEQGFADELPYESDSFDRVFSSYMFHHLDKAGREAALREVLRVLKPGGSFHLLDFVSNHDGPQGFLHRLIDSHGELKHNSDESLVESMRSIGFTEPEKVKSESKLFGLLRMSQFVGRR